MVLSPPVTETLVEARWSANGVRSWVRTEQPHHDPLGAILTPLWLGLSPLLPCLMAAHVWEWGRLVTVLCCGAIPWVVLPAMAVVTWRVTRQGRRRRLHLSPARLSIEGVGVWDLAELTAARSDGSHLILEGPEPRVIALNGTSLKGIAWLAEQIQSAAAGATDRGTVRDLDPRLSEILHRARGHARPQGSSGPPCATRSDGAG